MEIAYKTGATCIWCGKENYIFLPYEKVEKEGIVDGDLCCTECHHYKRFKTDTDNLKKYETIEVDKKSIKRSSL